MIENEEDHINDEDLYGVVNEKYIKAISDVGLENEGIYDEEDLHMFLVGSNILAGDLNGTFLQSLIKAGLTDQAGNVITFGLL